MKNILFVTAQPDVPYFIWQIKLYVNNVFSNIFNDDVVLHAIVMNCANEVEDYIQFDNKGKIIGISENIFKFCFDEDVKSRFKNIKTYATYASKINSTS